MLNIKDFFQTSKPLIFFLGIFFLISPGYIYLFGWHRDLFMQLDWVKLVILSASMLVPVVFVNTMLYTWFDKVESTQWGVELVEVFTVTTIFSGSFSFVALVVAYLSSTNVLHLSLFTEIVLSLFMYFESRTTRKEKNVA